MQKSAATPSPSTPAPLPPSVQPLVAVTQPTSAATSVPTTPPWLQWWKDGSAATASTATVIGIIVGAFWSYFLLVRRREEYPRAEVAHSISYWRVGEKAILRVTIRIKNISSVLIRVHNVRAVIQQVTPLPDDIANAIRNGADPVIEGRSELFWDTVAERDCDVSKESVRAEPGETEECIFDFAVPGNIERFQIYTHVTNQQLRRKNIGWNTTTLYAIEDNANGEVGAENKSRQSESHNTSCTAKDEGAMKMAKLETRQGHPKETKPKVVTTDGGSKSNEKKS